MFRTPFVFRKNALGMNRRFWAGNAALACLFIFPAAARAFTMSYDQAVAIGTEQTDAKVVVSDRSFRVERTQDGRALVTVRNSDGLFAYYPDARIGAKIDAMDASQQRLLDNLANYPAYLRRHRARVIGEETVRELACDVYLVEDAAIGVPMKVWLWKEEHIPLRLQILSPRGKVTVELKNIKLGVRAAEAQFALPVGLQLIEPESLHAVFARSSGNEGTEP